MLLGFLTFMTVGFTVGAASTALTLFFQRRDWRIALIAILANMIFPFYYFIFYLPEARIELVNPGTVPPVFVAAPLIFIILMQSFFYLTPLLMKSSPKRLVLYQIIGGSTAAGGTVVLLFFSEFYGALTTFLCALVSLPTGSFAYRKMSEKEELEKRILSFVALRRMVSLEDVMQELDLPDFKAKELLYDLWYRDKLLKSTLEKKDLYSLPE